ncbi:MAG: FTR1 family protein, partial [Thermodesulfobacteriota bacterium]
MKAGRIVIIALTFLIFPLFPSHGEGAVREAATVLEGGMSSGGVVRGDDIDAPGDSPYGKVLLAQASLATEEGAEKLSAPAKGGDNAPKGSGYGFFFNAFIIILREGFEAILVISALAAYLARSGNGEKVRTVYMGGGWALLASVVTAVTLSTVFTVGEEGKEAVEGVTMLLATAVLFYVSYWLITKSEVTRWQGYIKSKVERSISKRSVL